MDKVRVIYPPVQNVLPFWKREPNFLVGNAKLIDTGDGNCSTVCFQHPAHAGIIKNYQDVQAELAALA